MDCIVTLQRYGGKIATTYRIPEEYASDLDSLCVKIIKQKKEKEPDTIE